MNLEHACTLTCDVQTLCRRVIASAVRAQKRARNGDKVELELRMGAKSRYPLSALPNALMCIDAPDDLLDRPPSLSAVRTHDATPLRCVTYNGQPCFWERKELIAACRVPLATSHACRLVASVESPEPRPDAESCAAFTQQRTRRRYSTFSSSTGVMCWRLDVTIVDESYFTIEYEYAQPLANLSFDEALRNVQWLVAQWVPAHLVATRQSVIGPLLPLTSTPKCVRCPSWHGHNSDFSDAMQIAPQPVSLTRKRLALVAKNTSRWAVSAKLDGVRALLWCACHNNMPRCVLHVARTSCMYVLPASVGVAVAAREGTLVLDCELMWPTSIVAFDVLMRHGRALRDVPYGERFAMAQADARTIGMKFPMPLSSKRLFPTSHAHVAAQMAGDGVILHALDSRGDTFKWKPVHTVDLKCTGTGQLIAGKQSVVGQAAAGMPTGIWECSIAGPGQFKPIRPRLDKRKPNSKLTFDEVMQAHRDNITLRDLTDACQAGERV